MAWKSALVIPLWIDIANVFIFKKGKKVKKKSKTKHFKKLVRGKLEHWPCTFGPDLICKTKSMFSVQQ